VKSRKPLVIPKKNALNLFKESGSFLMPKQTIVKMIAIKNGAFESFRQVAIIKKKPLAPTKNSDLLCIDLR
jgi:hypothetical protein